MNAQLSQTISAVCPVFDILPPPARALGMHPAGAQTALACSTRLAPRVRRLENSPGTGMPQPTRGGRFGSCDITAHGNLDPPAGRALGFRLNPWIRLVVARSRSALSRARSESQRSESDLRNQKQKKRKIRKEEMENQRWEIEFTESWRHGTRYCSRSERGRG